VLPLNNAFFIPLVSTHCFCLISTRSELVEQTARGSEGAADGSAMAVKAMVDKANFLLYNNTKKRRAGRQHEFLAQIEKDIIPSQPVKYLPRASCTVTCCTSKCGVVMIPFPLLFFSSHHPFAAGDQPTTTWICQLGCQFFFY